MAAKRYAVVLSDVHIGNGAPTCWYQAPVHEPRLTEALAWILARREVIREVVLLGDLFDVWTYPPSQRPPSMGDIIAANRTLLGPSGPLAAVARAFPGEVRMLLGNHDGSLTRADIDLLNRSLGARIELIEGPWRVVDGASGARTVFTHGHYWCMFNAPDARSRWATIPVGHFVTRAIGYQLSRTLRRGETAADRRNSGNPNGVDLLAALASWNRRDDLAAFLLSYICRVTGMPQTERIVMPDGSTTTVREAMRVYDGLFTKWVRREGRALTALRAAAADWRGEDLAWFAQRLALQTASDLAVMGHTHVPVGGLTISPTNYVNSGYECVARPDAPPRQFTFTQVDLERATAQVLAVTPRPGGFTVTPARAPAMPSVIRRPWMDYSCYARIENRTDRLLRLVRANKDGDSFWVVPPPAVIRPRSRADIWVSDSIGLSGSGGRFSYTDGTRTLEFVVACPTGVARNVVRSPVTGYRTRTGNSGWRTGGVDWFGHPVQTRFVVEPVRTAAVVPAVGRPAAQAEAGEYELPRAGGGRVAARILWPALGFPAVIAPRPAPQGPAGAQHTICVLLLSDRPTLTAEDAARHLRIVPWNERTRRQVPATFSASELTVRSGAALERPQKDKHGVAVVFGGDRYERCIAASLSQKVRELYAQQGLRHLHEIRVSEQATGRLPDGPYHVLWNGSAPSGLSDEMRLLVDRIAVPRRRRIKANTEAERRWLQRSFGFLIDEYRYEYGALHPPNQETERRFTEVLHPVFVRRQSGSLRIAHLTDTHVDVRNDVYEENLRRPPAGSKMWAAGGQPFYQGVPVQFNNWNRSFDDLYADAKQAGKAILITGDLIDYGRGHIGLVEGGRHRHELGREDRYHTDRNWFLLYYLLAAGNRYSQPVYTSLGNHDWRVNPYPPFAPETPGPTSFVHNSERFDIPVRPGSLKEILQIAHGPGHDKRFVYSGLDVSKIVSGGARYVAGQLDHPNPLDYPDSPVYTTVDSVLWYLLLINPFLDYAVPHPGGQQLLMLDWAEQEELFNTAKPGGPRAACSLTSLQQWHVKSFVESAGRAKLIGIHAPPLGPYPEWNDDDLPRGVKTYKPAKHMYRPGGASKVERHPIMAIRAENDPYLVSAEYGSFVKQRDWFIREVGKPASGVRAVLSGHIHRFGLLVAYFRGGHPKTRVMTSVSLEHVKARRNLPSPLYVNTTSAGPRGNLYAATGWRPVRPGWSLVTLAPDGRIESVSPRSLRVEPPVIPPPRREVARFLQRSRA